MVLRTSYSFEFFPPKDVEGEERLWAAIDGLKSIAPDFVSVTYGAGGNTRDRSIRIAQEITKRTGISTVAHLTCVGSTRDELIAILHNYKEAGITSILHFAEIQLVDQVRHGHLHLVASIMQMS